MQQAVGMLILDLLAVVCNTKLIMVLDKVLFLAHGIYFDPMTLSNLLWLKPHSKETLSCNPSLKVMIQILVLPDNFSVRDHW